MQYYTAHQFRSLPFFPPPSTVIHRLLLFEQSRPFFNIDRSQVCRTVHLHTHTQKKNRCPFSGKRRALHPSKGENHYYRFSLSQRVDTSLIILDTYIKNITAFLTSSDNFIKSNFYLEIYTDTNN